MHFFNTTLKRHIRTFSISTNSKVSIIPWSPTKMMLTQRCSFICLSPSISWPTILSISLRGLFNWNTQEESRTTYSVLPWHRHIKACIHTLHTHSTPEENMTHICVHGSHFVSICVWLFRVHGVNIRPGSRQILRRQYHMVIFSCHKYQNFIFHIFHFTNSFVTNLDIYTNAVLSMSYDQDLSLYFDVKRSPV